MNIPLLVLIFLIPLQNIYIGKIPNLGQGINVLNVLMILAFYYSFKYKETIFKNELSSNVTLLILAYIVSYIKSVMYMGSFDTDSLNILKDILFSYLFFFVVYKSCTNLKKMKFMFFASVLPLPYMFKVFYTNLSWMGFSSYRDKLRGNSGTFMLLGSNEIAAFYATYTFVILAIAFQEQNRKLKLALFAVAGMNIYCLVYAFSRGAYLASLVGLAALAWFNGKMKLFIVALIAVSIMITAGVEVFPKAVTERFDSTFVAEGERDESAQSRFILWDIAIDTFSSNPVLGIGLGNFRKANPFGLDTHNYFVKMLVEGGILQFSILVAFLLKAIKQTALLYKVATEPFLKALAIGMLSCLFAVIVGNCFGDRFSHYPLISYLFVYLAMVMRGLELSKEAPDAATAGGIAFNK